LLFVAGWRPEWLAYTWSKNLGNVNNLITADNVGEGNANYQNSYARQIEKSVSTHDIPQRLAMNGTLTKQRELDLDPEN
jgi:hypothetical protein